MIFTLKRKWEIKLARLSEWHEWFAWHPIAVDISATEWRFIWLRTVERIGIYNGGVYGSWWDWKYSLK